MNITRVKEGFDLLDRGMRVLGSGPLDYYMKRLTGCYDLLLTRFAPYKVGERVQLTKAPEITSTKNHGWLGAKHLLVVGAPGIVREIEADFDGFSFHVEIENQTWFDSRGQEHPHETPYLYHFGESWLEHCSHSA